MARIVEGEIFEYNSEWYQCLEEKTCTCFGCDFRDYNCDDISLKEVKGSCQSERRKDNKSVIFKKLEKVGEPYMLEDKKFQKYKVFKTPYIYNKIDCSWQSFADPYYVSLEISLTKEDMEERYKILEDLVNQYMKADITYKEFEEGIEKWYKKYGKNTEKKLNFKPFNLEAAKSGKPVCTRDGRKARIICFDAKFPKTGNIVTLVEKENGEEVTLYHYDDGHCSIGRGYDLMMLPEKKEGWVNLYDDIPIYDTKEEALSRRSKIRGLIDTIKVSWEE